MRDPKVTVLTTVYNGERYINEAIESILAQDFTDYEYLIVDDGSTDRTPQIPQWWSERDPVSSSSAFHGTVELRTR